MTYQTESNALTKAIELIKSFFLNCSLTPPECFISFCNCSTCCSLNVLYTRGGCWRLLDDLSNCLDGPLANKITLKLI